MATSRKRGLLLRHGCRTGTQSDRAAADVRNSQREGTADLAKAAAPVVVRAALMPPP